MYKAIDAKEKYDALLKSGVFFVFHPELTGDWETDRKVINSKKNNPND